MDPENPSSKQIDRLMVNLRILQNQYRKLQCKYRTVKDELDAVFESVQWPTKSTKTFIHRLVESIALLENNELYSDIKIKLNEDTLMPGHRFVLQAHEDFWLERISEFANEQLDLSEFSLETSKQFVDFLYTNRLDFPDDEHSIAQIKQMMLLANRLKLSVLFERCEYILMGFIDLKSVISIYEFACEIEALRTKEFCADILFDNWAAFENEEFACLKIDDLYDLLQSRSLYPLHRAIEIHRDDVAYVYLLNNRGENSIEKLNQSDENGRIPLELALSTNQYSIAETLIEDGADIDHPIEDFKCLLHYYINNGKYDAAQFLVEHTCNINIPDEKHGTALHFLTRPPNNEQCNELVRKIISLCEDINAIDSNGNTALHLSITNANNLFRLFDFLSL